MKDSFILYTEYQDIIDELDDDKAGQLFKAIMYYAATGEVPDMNEVVKAHFSHIKKRLDRDAAKYEETCRKRAESGQKGGIAKGKLAKQTVAKIANAKFAKQTVANQADNDLDLDNDLDCDNDLEGLIVHGANSAPEEAPVITLELNDKSEYPVTQAAIIGWSELYPAVDVIAELRKMKGWISANPQKRKTSRGIKRFINGWLAREQDRGGNARAAPPSNPTSNPFLALLEEGEAHDTG